MTAQNIAGDPLVVHLQLQDTTLACGAPHRKGTVGCCRLTIGKVTCEACLSAARLSRLPEDQPQVTP